MRILLIAVTVLAGLWSGYWLIGSTAKETVIGLWLEDREKDGWNVAFSSFDVVGFPNRFDSRFEDIAIADPRAGWSWQAPFFNILALSYQPNHIIAVWPHRQVIGLPRQEITITSEEMIASVVFEPDTKLALDRTALRTSSLLLSSTLGWTMAADSFNFSTRQNQGTPFAHSLYFEAVNLTPTQQFKDTLDPLGALPATITRLTIDTDVAYDAPWDRVAVETSLPLATEIVLNSVVAKWGALSLRATGTVSILSNGTLNGRIDLKIEDWRGVLSVGVSSGLFDQVMADRLETGLSLLTALSDDPTALKAPLLLKDGQMSLGPIPLGQAPRILRP